MLPQVQLVVELVVLELLEQQAQDWVLLQVQELPVEQLEQEQHIRMFLPLSKV